MPIVWSTGISALDELNDLAITSGATNDILQRNSSGIYVNRQPVGTEASTTKNSAAANDTVVGTALTYYAFITLPTTAPLWLLTGVEWKNGTVVNGTIMAAVHMVDADPPSANASMMIAQIMQTAQTGVSAVQRAPLITPVIVPSGTLLAVGVVSNSATARLLTATVASRNNTRAVTFTQATLTGSSVAWAATTEEIYCKLYYKPVMGI